MRIRILGAEETDLLKDFLYEAIFIPEGVEPPDRSIIELPELRVYYEDFGKGRADHCVVADDDGKVVGAVWSRIMNDYGHIDDETPSLAISLYKEYRGKGIGTLLMRDILALLRERVTAGRRWRCKKPITLSGCMRRPDLRRWARMNRNT